MPLESDEQNHKQALFSLIEGHFRVTTPAQHPNPSVDRGSVTLGDYGSRTNQRSVRRVPIMPPDRIRTMPFGTGVVLLRSAPPIITDLHPWPKRSDAAVLKRERSEIEALLEKPPAAE